MARNRGFSLIELMITVAIIGILAALAVPAWAAATAKARQTEAKAGLKAIHSLQIGYHGEHNEYGTLAEIGFVPEGSTRYGYMISDDAGGVIEPNGGMDTGGGGADPLGPIFNPDPAPDPDPTPDPYGPDDDDDIGPTSGGGGGCTVCGGSNPKTGDYAFGNPHVSGESFEAVAIGVISGAPSPNDIDVWSVDQTGWIENLNPGY